MKKDNFWLQVICGAFCFICISCSMFGKEAVPYLIKGEMVLADQDSDFTAGGFDMTFVNKSEKPVTEFTVVFYLFDEDGEPVSDGKTNIVLTVKKDLFSFESVSCCISLDKYLYEIPELPYDVDYLYVSKIKYADGTVWDDPFGLAVF